MKMNLTKNRFAAYTKKPKNFKKKFKKKIQNLQGSCFKFLILKSEFKIFRVNYKSKPD